MSDPLLGRCRAHGLAVGPDGRCALCRRVDAQRSDGPRSRWSARRGFVIAAAVALFVVFVVALGWQVRRRAVVEATEPVAAAPRVLPIRTANSVGRTGAYYLPAMHRDRALPLVMVFHGSGGSGWRFANTLAPIAEARGFIAVAPDSGIAAGGPNWRVADRPGELTDDFRHAERCLAEVLARPRVRVDETRLVALGYSGGGSSAAHFCTADPRCSAFAVLHGGVFAGGLGQNPARAWFSTGEGDPARPVARVREAEAAARSRGLAVTFRIYPGGHDLSAAELEDALDFLLGVR